MKKIILFLLSTVLILSLCACGASQVDTTPSADTTEQIIPTDTTAPTETTAASAGAKELAEGCIEKSVDDLFALIGQPDSTDYAPSCLGPGEDGMLYYEDFIVYTYREDGKETVEYVE